MSSAVEDQAQRLIAIYDVLLPEVYGYLLDRCGNRSVAEDLTSETFLAAVRADASPDPAPLSAPWIVGVARHKLADHWRRRGRDDRLVERLDPVGQEDPWDAKLDQLTTSTVLDLLEADHRAALTFRYLDGLPVPEVAGLLGRSVHATESLLVRARGAFRRAYERGQSDG
jgi:RNA polymerase sigma-70 factor (ECF subfamily)